jgi:hypothetical protein
MTCLLAAACVTPAPSPNEGPAPGPAPASVGAPAVAGRWSSPSCGTRTYERRLTLDPGGTFAAEDRVSPCPPGATCVWAGILFTRGAYSVSGDGARTVQLSISAGGPPRGQPFPATLEIDASGALVEVLPEGERCVYTRASP